MMATGTKEFMTDMFKQATETFNSTMRAGAEFQEQSTKFWTDAFNEGFGQFQTQFENFSNETMPMAKKNLEQFHGMFEQQSKKSFDTLRKAFEGKGEVNFQQTFDQTMDLWRNSFDAMRSNVDMMAKANMEMLENFCDMAKGACSTGNGHSAKAAAKPATK